MYGKVVDSNENTVIMLNTVVKARHRETSCMTIRAVSQSVLDEPFCVGREWVTSNGMPGKHNGHDMNKRLGK